MNHIIKVTPPRRLIDETVKRIADEKGVSVNDAMSRSRKRAHVDVRIAAMRAVWEAGGGRYSLESIGRAFGGYDHSTVLHHLKTDEWRERRAAMRQRKYYDHYREKRVKS